MLINRKNRLNRFAGVAIPTARRLFEQYGFSKIVTCHPDNTDPYKFGDVQNQQFSTNLGQLGAAGRSIVRSAREMEYQESKKHLTPETPPSNEPAPTSPINEEK